MTKKIAFYDSKSYDRETFDKVNEDFGYRIDYFKEHLSKDTAVLAREHDAVCIFVNDKVDKAVVKKFKEYGVDLIALRCAGYNNVDLEAVYENIHVVRVPAYSPHAVAEHALALMLTLNRKTHRAYYRTKDRNFNIEGLKGFDMAGKTAGIIGTGQIGRVLIKILKGLDMKVLAYDIAPDEEFAKNTGFEYVGLEGLYKRSDIISLNCPLTPETRHIINRDSISMMKEGVMIINTGRGQLIETGALIDALKNRKIGSAGLDVYEEESEYFFEDFSSQIIDDDILARLLTFPNVLVTSHQGFFTKEALENIAGTTLKNIEDYFKENKLENEVCYRCDSEPCRKEEEGRCF
ncbi:MAG: 2-hydroxyacid dehydrogenase [Elusimicrobiota bacterium]